MTGTVGGAGHRRDRRRALVSYLPLPLPLLPEFELPELELPEFEPPELEPPEFELPEFEPPEFEPPDLEPPEPPDFPGPELSAFEFPEFGPPGFSWFELSDLDELEVPESPGFPDLTEFESSEFVFTGPLESSDFDAPESDFEFSGFRESLASGSFGPALPGCFEWSEFSESPLLELPDFPDWSSSPLVFGCVSSPSDFPPASRAASPSVSCPPPPVSFTSPEPPDFPGPDFTGSLEFSDFDSPESDFELSDFRESLASGSFGPALPGCFEWSEFSESPLLEPPDFPDWSSSPLVFGCVSSPSDFPPASRTASPPAACPPPPALPGASSSASCPPLTGFAWGVPIRVVSAVDRIPVVSTTGIIRTRRETTPRPSGLREAESDRPR